MTLGLLANTLYRPPLGLPVLVLLVGLVAVLLLLAARREHAWRTLAFRLGALAGLAWLLMGPSITTPGKPTATNLPKLAILIDTSASMARADVMIGQDEPTTRLDAVTDAWLNDSRIAQLRRHADIELLAFNDQVQPADQQDLQPTGTSTRLYAALERSRADATLILSDGHDTTPAATHATFEQAGRLYASPVGTPRSSPDLAIDAWPESDRLFEGQSTTITATLRNRGFDALPAVVELLHNGEVIERSLLKTDSENAKLTYEIKPALKPGLAVEAHQYTVRVRLGEGVEAYTANNQQDLFVQVSRGKVRVLLLEGEPYWDTRSLSRVIGAHPRFDLTAVYGFGERRRSRVLGESYEVGSDPADQLERFDIVVLGRRVDRLVDEGFGKRLIDYVQDGGAVVFARGQAFDTANPLGRELDTTTQALSPGRWARPIIGAMRVRLNEADDAPSALSELADQAVISRLPGMLAATRIEQRKTASLILLEQQQGDASPPMAALTTLRVGSGIAMAVLTEGLWRWELLPGIEEDEQAESAYEVFWIRGLQWLASGGDFLPGQDIALEADRLSMTPGQSTTLTISTRYIEADTPDLRLSAIGTDGSKTPIPLRSETLANRFSASYMPSKPGITRFILEAPGRPDLIDPDHPLTTSIAVVERSREKRDTAAQPKRLKAITEATGGQCLELDEPEPLIEYLQTLQMTRGTQDTTAYDFNRWPVFLWIVGCLGLEWVLRRRSGLR